MAHQYGQPIEVTSLASEPQSFMWHGREYTIVEILAAWHLRDRWWNPPRAGIPPNLESASDRHYYRVQCADGLLCDVYYDAARAEWVLDRVHD